ncbi:hypothetical protein [Tateyamaria pelophila]|uniref:hypothetical protein n=1 Tax=Tateyamaria pelophila TaxID=328415 RepID=UPI001CBA9015|nr:hypothetical protein [Tateyamaria pelophila]
MIKFEPFLGRPTGGPQGLQATEPLITGRLDPDSNLEDELRVALFERGSGPLVLTKHGLLLLFCAEQMLFVEEEIKQRVADAAETKGFFRAGASEAIAQAWLPAFVTASSQPQDDRGGHCGRPMPPRLRLICQRRVRLSNSTQASDRNRLSSRRSNSFFASRFGQGGRPPFSAETAFHNRAAYDFLLDFVSLQKQLTHVSLFHNS